MLKYLCQIHLWTPCKLNNVLCTRGFTLVKCYLLKYKNVITAGLFLTSSKSESLKLNYRTTGIFWNPSQLYLSYKILTSCPFKTTVYFDALVSTPGSDEGLCIIHDPWMSGVFPVAYLSKLDCSFHDKFLSSSSIKYDQAIC